MKFRDKIILRNFVVIGVTLIILTLALKTYLDYPLNSAESNELFSKYSKAAYIVYPTVDDSPLRNSEYPTYQPLLDVVKNWNPDDSDLPAFFQETLQHFNFSDPRERGIALEYRNAELPFKMYNVPYVDSVCRKWTDSYLRQSLRFHIAGVERSTTNRFMYYSTLKRGSPKGYIPPQQSTFLTYTQFATLAHEADKKKLSSNSTHYYFVLNSNTRGDLATRLTSSSFISKDLEIFSTPVNNFFIPDVSQNKGIQCRFGMRGVIAAAHYDSGRNMVAMLRGEKRYILTPPHTCKYLGIITDEKHPSYRHSVVDWANLSQAEQFRFGQVDAIDTIVRTGEVLYIPSFWFHYIVSLDNSIQCNSRSGYPARMQGKKDIFNRHCMNGQTGLSGNIIPN